MTTSIRSFCLLLWFALPCWGIAAEARIGWSFDTGVSPDRTREMFVTNPPGRAPAGSWLRLRGMEGWFTDAVPATNAAPAPQIASRRDDLLALQRAGFRLVAILRWSPKSWKEGVRGPARDNRLPEDLREAYERCRVLAATYGDLIDYWEIDNEPDISFVRDNPETYAAFLKACYLGVRRGAAAAEVRSESERESGRRSESESEARPGRGSRGSLGPGSLVPRPHERSLVLMAPLALPPGPYFEAFVKNDGMRYTDGFNYHFYGYAEDFSGMYHQFERAVVDLLDQGLETRDQRLETRDKGLETRDQGPGTSDRGTRAPQGAVRPGSTQAQPPLSPSLSPSLRAAEDAVFYTNFYPSADGWRGTILQSFDHAPADVDARAEGLVARPRAAEEPALSRAGRWLVSDGVTVEESGDTWRFRVSHWPAGALRAPAIELPLPTGWQPGENSLISFQYRLVDGPGDAQPISATSPEALRHRPGAGSRAPGAKLLPQGRGDARATTAGSSETVEASSWPVRELPVFLTEYGYGGLDKESRRTAAGRERQRVFFESVVRQIRELGIEGAMAFLLVPYLEHDLLEFGLLMNEESGPGNLGAAGAKTWGSYTVSPALEQLLRDAESSFQPRRWKVSTPPPAPVVIDFVAGKGLGQAKSYSGYFLEGEHGRSIPGEGELVLYNFDASPVSGAVELEGEAWSFANGRRRLSLTLEAGERRVLAVHVSPTAKEFVACPVGARFRAGPEEPVEESVAPVVAAAESPVPAVRPRSPAPATAPEGPLHMFECYFRTENGNLYQTWPRLLPSRTWQVYMQRMENFTPAFYGRHHLPWRFEDNEPVSLVFYFHPAAFPVTFEVKAVRTVQFSAP